MPKQKSHQESSPHENPSLMILKASAGSGKTYSMARLYLQFLLKSKNYYRHVLAVTFTNKATSELKERILAELNLLAASAPSDHAEFLMEKCALNADQLAQSAHKILEALLQDYSNFHIYTIDGFFQFVLKGFFREIGLQNQYNIELNQAQVLDKATNLVFFQLAEKNDQELVKWLTKYSETEIEEGKSWNLKNSIKTLGNELFSEKYRQYNSNTEDLDNVLHEISDLQQRTYRSNKAFSDKVRNLSDEFLTAAYSKGLTINDFKGKSRSVFANMERLKKSTTGVIPAPNFEKYVDNIDEIVSKTAKNRAEIEALYNLHFNPILIRLKNLFELDFGTYTKNRLVRKNLYSLGVIKYIQSAIRDLNEEQNSILISDSNDLIAKIIANSDASFIYEKTGNKFWNYMVDEFQDTSRMQWNNLKPLIDNSMALGQQNLIVGDVKQSIYRWRNSDWKMLGGEIRNEFGAKMARESHLPANYRSSQNIVNFNNAIFDAARQTLVNAWEDEESDLGDYVNIAYNESYQEAAKRGATGFVRGLFLEAESAVDYRTISLDRFVSQIQELLEKGYALSDICVLVRKNSEGQEIIDHAKKVLGQQVNFVSEESYFLSSSYVVQMVISILKYIKGQTPILLNEVLFLMQTYHNTKEQSLFPEWVELKLKGVKTAASTMSLVNLVHHIILTFKLEEDDGQQAFLLALLDELKSLQDLGNSGIEEFLSFWETHGHKMVLRNAQNKNAIRIMTVHKSKGLEFNIVMLPFVDWELEPGGVRAPFIWCENDIRATNDLKVLPVKYAKDMALTSFKDAYYLEKVQSNIDNLNVLYVAFTRAKHGLIFNAFVKITKTRKPKLNSTSLLLKHIFTTPELRGKEKLLNLTACYDTEKNSFEYGEIDRAVQTSKAAPTYPLSLHIKRPSEDIRIKKKAAIDHTDRPVKSETSSLPSTIRMGVLLHHIFETLDQLKDFATHFDHMTANEKVDVRYAEKIKQNILAQLSEPQIKAWFDKKSKALKETNLLTPQGEVLRPDRVIENEHEILVVDYKFGSVKSPKHASQVNAYKKALGSMYKQKVKGYIWYVMNQEVVEV